MVLLSVFLIAAIFSILPASAQEIGVMETTVPETVPVETVPETTVPETTEAETTVPETTETMPVQTIPEETREQSRKSAPALMAEASDAGQMVVTPIAQLSEMNANMGGATIRGTVVWLGENRAVLQDDTGGVLLALPEEAAKGDILLITGITGETFAVEQVTKEGTGPLPVVETTLEEAPEALRVTVEGSTDGETLTDGNRSLPLETEETITGDVEVTGVIVEGVFYADTVVPREERESHDWGWKLCFGLLHDHSEVSGGSGTVEEIYAKASETDNLDFFAVTDHSDSFDNAKAGTIAADGSAVSGCWSAGKQAAAAATGEDFVGIYGYEMTWGEDKALGHINTFHTSGWQTRDQPGMGTLAGYFAVLQTVPNSVSQFNHPGNAYGNFRGFRDYDPDWDACVQLLEVFGERGTSFLEEYIRALDAGWHVAPTASGNHHDWDWGDNRTVVLAQSLTENALYQAMRSRRVYATRDADLSLEFRLNGNVMGSVMGTAQSLEVSAFLEDPTDDTVGTVSVLTSGGKVLASEEIDTPSGEWTVSAPAGYPYYFLKVTQLDGDVAVTAPVWVDDFTDMGIRSLTAGTDAPAAGQSVTLTLELYNKEETAMEVGSVSLLLDGKEVGTFRKDEQGKYTCDFLREEPGEVRLTAVVQGTVDGKSRTWQETLTLNYQGKTVAKAAISDIRAGTVGEVYELEGYATSGNTNPYTTFPDTIYVQDNTGGIPVIGTFSDEIQVGTPLEVSGVLREQDGERYLDLTDYRILQKPTYRYVPKTMGCKRATDYDSRGGSLVQVEGTVTELTKTVDKKGISRLTIRDAAGNEAVVVIEPEIRSGAYGVNRLAKQIAKGKTVRAMGLLHRLPDGTAVLRVRNCDEVVYVPPVPDPTNPKTGDRMRFEIRK